MDERLEFEKADETMLPGFRFHPTDEELVGFYLKRKVQQRKLPIELIKQVDIYKYDPWDLPKVAASGEKEWYFYCPRDRKYRNSARPNRVTGAGFWKATGTDRPIYSSDGTTNCIGLKKSLVFYRGRAAEGMKTDWMMHEFRLPYSIPPKSFSEKAFPANDSWAICRIFKKTSSMAQRALSHGWMTPLLETTAADMFGKAPITQFSSDNISYRPKIGSALEFSQNIDLDEASNGSFSAVDFPSHKHLNSPALKFPPLFQGAAGELCNGFMIPPLEVSGSNECGFDSVSVLLRHNSIGFTPSPEIGGFDGEPTAEPGAFSISFSSQMQANMGMAEYEEGLKKNCDETDDNNLTRSTGFPFGLPSNDGWKYSLPWDSPPFSSEMSTSCYPPKSYKL